jgi:hypothetical protein
MHGFAQAHPGVFKVTVSHHLGQHLRDIELIPGRIGLPDIP